MSAKFITLQGVRQIFLHSNQLYLNHSADTFCNRSTINTKTFLYTEIHSPNHKYGIAEYDFNLLLGKPFFPLD